MKFVCTVDFTIEAKDDFHHTKQLDSYLRQAFREFAAQYNILDYEYLHTRYGSNNVQQREPVR